MSDRNPYTDMLAINGPNCCIAIGPDSFILRDTDGKEWRTEWHPYCGPTHVSKKTDDPLAIQPSAKSRFWLVAQWWKDQGGKVVDGIGVWKEPKIIAKRFRRIGRRDLVVMPDDYAGPDLVVLEYYEGYPDEPVRRAAKKGK